jgi:hypothetical protein
MKSNTILSCLIIVLLGFYTEGSFAQVAVNTDGSAADSKAMLDVKSTDKGLLIPRMTTAQRTGITGLTVSQKGLLVYDTDLNAVWQYNGTAWTEVGAIPVSVWTTLNATTIYTTKQQVGINNADPKAALHVNGQVVVNTDGSVPSTKAQLDVKSTTKGTHITRMTSAQRIAINPTASDVGLMVFDLDVNRLYLFDGQSWLPVTTGNIYDTPITSRTATDGINGDFFGGSVAISGDYAIIGAGSKTVGGNTNQGVAYIFFRSGSAWTQQAQLMAIDGASGDHFGSSVSISGDYVLVGASGKTFGGNVGQGAAYIFLRSGTTWTQQAKILSSDGAIGDNFGNSVAISGDYALVGATFKSAGAGNLYVGAAYIFFRSGVTWTQQAKIMASDADISDYFGCSVAISGDYALVGAYQKSSSFGHLGTFHGAAYIFLRSGTTWAQQAKLQAAGGVTGTFGTSVAISGDYAVIGDPRRVVGSLQTGVAYVFSRTGASWTQQVLISAADAATSDNFGGSVSISGDYIIVGAPGKTIDGNANQGAAYLFKKNISVWEQKKKLTNTLSGSTGSTFGYAVGITPNACIIGEPYGLSPLSELRIGNAHFWQINF